MKPSRIQGVWGLKFVRQQRQRASGDCGRPEGAPGVHIGGQPPPSPQSKREDLGGRGLGGRGVGLCEKVTLGTGT